MDPITTGIVLFFMGFMAFDSLKPARKYPKIRGWTLRGVVAFVIYFAISSYSPFLWDEWLGEHRLIDATGLGTWGGAAVGFLAAQLGMYVWHRALHGNNVLWRYLHQMHHSAERVDVASAYYFSPLDMLGWTFVTSLSLVWVVGITPEAALIDALALTFTGVFTHANIRTPRWLGYFIARPEMHAVHHARGVHSGNYCDLPLVDMIFGSYRNPQTFDGEVGFYDGASSRLLEMLLGRDVSRPGGLGAQRDSSAGDETTDHPVVSDRVAPSIR